MKSIMIVLGFLEAAFEFRRFYVYLNGQSDDTFQKFEVLI